MGKQGQLGNAKSSLIGSQRENLTDYRNQIPKVLLRHFDASDAGTPALRFYFRNFHGENNQRKDE